jgi:hypothetical protein
MRQGLYRTRHQHFLYELALDFGGSYAIQVSNMRISNRVHHVANPSTASKPIMLDLV